MLKPRLFRLLNISSVLIIIATFLGWKLLGDRNNWTAVSGEAPPPAEAWIVTKVSDGDTITVRQTDGQEMKVRLGCIDAPEIKHGQTPGQLLGEESKKNLRRLVDEAGSEVMVSVIDTDRYGRKVAEVFTSVKGGEKSLNEEQLTSGMAYFYKKYSNCPNREVFQRAEQIAIANRVGVWSQSGLEMPWDYRRRIREN
ncbi:MAG: thermonuclease family protein [Gloeotrichia echinulata HAB0833]